MPDITAKQNMVKLNENNMKAWMINECRVHGYDDYYQAGQATMRINTMEEKPFVEFYSNGSLQGHFDLEYKGRNERLTDDSYNTLSAQFENHFGIGLKEYHIEKVSPMWHGKTLEVSADTIRDAASRVYGGDGKGEQYLSKDGTAVAFGVDDPGAVSVAIGTAGTEEPETYTIHFEDNGNGPVPNEDDLDKAAGALSGHFQEPLMLYEPPKMKIIFTGSDMVKDAVVRREDGTIDNEATIKRLIPAVEDYIQREGAVDMGDFTFANAPDFFSMDKMTEHMGYILDHENRFTIDDLREVGGFVLSSADPAIGDGKGPYSKGFTSLVKPQDYRRSVYAGVDTSISSKDVMAAKHGMPERPVRNAGQDRLFGSDESGTAAPVASPAPSLEQNGQETTVGHEGDTRIAFDRLTDNGQKALIASETGFVSHIGDSGQLTKEELAAFRERGADVGNVLGFSTLKADKYQAITPGFLARELKTEEGQERIWNAFLKDMTECGSLDEFKEKADISSLRIETTSQAAVNGQDSPVFKNRVHVDVTENRPAVTLCHMQVDLKTGGRAHSLSVFDAAGQKRADISRAFPGGGRGLFREDAGSRMNALDVTSPECRGHIKSELSPNKEDRFYSRLNKAVAEYEKGILEHASGVLSRLEDIAPHYEDLANRMEGLEGKARILSQGEREETVSSIKELASVYSSGSRVENLRGRLEGILDRHGDGASPRRGLIAGQKAVLTERAEGVRSAVSGIRDALKEYSRSTEGITLTSIRGVSRLDDAFQKISDAIIKAGPYFTGASSDYESDRAIVRALESDMQGIAEEMDSDYTDIKIPEDTVQEIERKAAESTGKTEGPEYEKAVEDGKTAWQKAAFDDLPSQRGYAALVERANSGLAEGDANLAHKGEDGHFYTEGGVRLDSPSADPLARYNPDEDRRETKLDPSAPDFEEKFYGGPDDRATQMEEVLSRLEEAAGDVIGDEAGLLSEFAANIPDEQRETAINQACQDLGIPYYQGMSPEDMVKELEKKDGESQERVDREPAAKQDRLQERTGRPVEKQGKIDREKGVEISQAKYDEIKKEIHERIEKEGGNIKAACKALSKGDFQVSYREGMTETGLVNAYADVYKTKVLEPLKATIEAYDTKMGAYSLDSFVLAKDRGYTWDNAMRTHAVYNYQKAGGATGEGQFIVRGVSTYNNLNSAIRWMNASFTSTMAMRLYDRLDLGKDATRDVVASPKISEEINKSALKDSILNKVVEYFRASAIDSFVMPVMSVAGVIDHVIGRESDYKQAPQGSGVAHYDMDTPPTAPDEPDKGDNVEKNSSAEGNAPVEGKPEDAEPPAGQATAEGEDDDGDWFDREPGLGPVTAGTGDGSEPAHSEGQGPVMEEPEQDDGPDWFDLEPGLGPAQQEPSPADEGTTENGEDDPEPGRDGQPVRDDDDWFENEPGIEPGMEVPPDNYGDDGEDFDEDFDEPALYPDDDFDDDPPDFTGSSEDADPLYDGVGGKEGDPQPVTETDANSEAPVIQAEGGTGSEDPVIGSHAGEPYRPVLNSYQPMEKTPEESQEGNGTVEAGQDPAVKDGNAQGATGTPAQTAGGDVTSDDSTGTAGHGGSADETKVDAAAASSPAGEAADVKHEMQDTLNSAEGLTEIREKIDALIEGGSTKGEIIHAVAEIFTDGVDSAGRDPDDVSIGVQDLFEFAANVLSCFYESSSAENIGQFANDVAAEIPDRDVFVSAMQDASTEAQPAVTQDGDFGFQEAMDFMADTVTALVDGETEESVIIDGEQVAVTSNGDPVVPPEGLYDVTSHEETLTGVSDFVEAYCASDTQATQVAINAMDSLGQEGQTASETILGEAREEVYATAMNDALSGTILNEDYAKAAVELGSSYIENAETATVDADPSAQADVDASMKAHDANPALTAEDQYTPEILQYAVDSGQGQPAADTGGTQAVQDDTDSIIRRMSAAEEAAAAVVAG